MAYIVMACIGMAYIVMAYTGVEMPQHNTHSPVEAACLLDGRRRRWRTPHAVRCDIVMAYIALACIAMACTVMAYIALACIVMDQTS